VRRRNDRQLLPEPSTALKTGDRLLVCASRHAFTRMLWTVSHRYTLEFVKTGAERAQSWLWRQLTRRRG
jgi:hypothetical protein